MGESVGCIQEYRVLFQERDFRKDSRHSHHIGGIVNEHTRITMIGVIIIRPRVNNEIGFLFPDQFNNLQTVLIGWH
jgi:hypothetical protein